MFVLHVSSDLKHKHKRLTAIKMENMKTLEMENMKTLEMEHIRMFVLHVSSDLKHTHKRHTAIFSCTTNQSSSASSRKCSSPRTRLSLNLAQRDVLIVSRMMHPSRPKNAQRSGGRCPERRPDRTAVHVIMHRAFHHNL